MNAAVLALAVVFWGRRDGDKRLDLVQMIEAYFTLNAKALFYCRPVLCDGNLLRLIYSFVK
ncbi:hypothetical protein CN165_31620 [Sinorhizobium medicae]|uniref:hypothetical protein n=1 Tax=Sinorhizobium medicae TaxID=110321 RepID=UPI000FD9A227|nr:hypothetical protein [Sinorhizobium medicae]RVK08596.1 hypothetical protein CN165_31620 [Sinorhizobium medicae]